MTDYKTRRSKVPFPPAWGGQPEEQLYMHFGITAEAVAARARALA